MLLRRLALAAFSFAALASAARAQTCPPARLLAAVQMQSAEPQSNIRTVPVTLNGVTGFMVLDTGLSLGGMTVAHPEVMIVPDVMNHNADTSPMTLTPVYHHNADLELLELSLGTDVLKHFHLYLAFDEQALYLAPADAIPAVPAAKP